ncbi:MAG: aminodeoxychorismate/anthranilate synthase component II [Verrucomicrobia bacterium]|jgi:anthranilate synthase component II|nr:aminodeoxychorismate/anthranilate synthase component II [Verrucomicrobiota bacterium]
MIILIDNYDSFTYNLVQVMMGQGAEIKVYRNDEITVDEVVAAEPEGLLISPGPCTPKQAGISVDLIQRMSGALPILGVCLGHQSICAAFGGEVSNAKSIMHGKTSMVHYEDSPLFRGMKNPFPAGRYHSLSVVRDVLPSDLIVDAWTDDGEVMGMHHVEHPTFGVQFHPESVLTPSGKRLLRNFQQIVESA